MAIILLECLTALLYLYLGLSLPWSSWQSLAGTLRELHFIIVVAAAVTTAWGVARHRQWATKGAIALAAYVGLPNLAVLGGVVQSIRASTQPPVLMSIVFVLGATVAQLAAFVLALRQLQERQAAA